MGPRLISQYVQTMPIGLARFFCSRSLKGKLSMPHYTGIATLLAILLYFYTGLRVGGARARFGIKAPAVSGHPDFERIMRVQMNTLEWMPIFLPAFGFLRFMSAIVVPPPSVWSGSPVASFTWSITQRRPKGAEEASPFSLLPRLRCSWVHWRELFGV